MLNGPKKGKKAKHQQEKDPKTTVINDLLHNCQIHLICFNFRDKITDMDTDKISGTVKKAHVLLNANGITTRTISGGKSVVMNFPVTVEGGEHIWPNVESHPLSWWAETHLRTQS